MEMVKFSDSILEMKSSKNILENVPLTYTIIEIGEVLL